MGLSYNLSHILIRNLWITATHFTLAVRFMKLFSRMSIPNPRVFLFVLTIFSAGSLTAAPQEEDASAAGDNFASIQPILEEHCFACHADGANEGSMSFDELFAWQKDSKPDRRKINEHWYKVLRQVQAGLMPPPEEERPTTAQIENLERWIKYSAFGLNPAHVDPGRVTIRRLNQVEYRNTIRDLLGVEYDTGTNFPADDTGHGFDNIGEVLSISPLLLEKYLNAAKEIVNSVVPVVPGVVHVETLRGDRFRRSTQTALNDLVPQEAGGAEASQRGTPASDGTQRSRRRDAEPGTTVLSYYEPATVAAELKVVHEGDYVLRLNLTARETYVDNQFDENRCHFTFFLGDDVLVDQEFVRQGRKSYVFEFNQHFQPGSYSLKATVTPLTESTQIRDLRLQLDNVELVGPNQTEFFDKPPGYERFFPKEVPDDDAERREYARELLRDFATRAFRRPVDDDSLNRLIALAESVYQDGDTFESGIAKSMTAVLASPKFLFREEFPDPLDESDLPLIDEYSLASRLSYFLWSSMPDAELMNLAEEGKLRSNLEQQIARLLADDKSTALAKNFVGQWLRARAVETIQINGAAVLSREPQMVDPEQDVRRRRFFDLFRKGSERTAEEDAEYQVEKEGFLRSFQTGGSGDLTDEVRQAMRRESELLFEYIVQNDRSLLDLVDSNYTFLNEPLWAHYQIAGVDGVEGDEMRLVQLPANSLRGGILTQGTTLVVTSNPDRTSPVKRGLFILENLLGTPPPAPPPNIPALEDVESDSEKTLTLRETLAIHRSNALCSSCHNQMDPLGLALENFNAMGQFREIDMGEPVDSSGTLGEGLAFSSVGQLKKILATSRQSQIYRCLTEKLMTFALGRAVEYTDAHTVDELVNNLQDADGKASALLHGIIRSDAFQRMRREPGIEPEKSLSSL